MGAERYFMPVRGVFSHYRGSNRSWGSDARGRRHVTPRNITESIHAKRVVGRIANRPEAVTKVTGEAKFSDDLVFDGMLVGRAKRTYVPHAFVKSIDISRGSEFAWCSGR